MHPGEHLATRTASQGSPHREPWGTEATSLPQWRGRVLLSVGPSWEQEASLCHWNRVGSAERPENGDQGQRLLLEGGAGQDGLAPASGASVTLPLSLVRAGQTIASSPAPAVLLGQDHACGAFCSAGGDQPPSLSWVKRSRKGARLALPS